MYVRALCRPDPCPTSPARYSFAGAGTLSKWAGGRIRTYVIQRKGAGVDTPLMCGEANTRSEEQPSHYPSADNQPD